MGPLVVLRVFQALSMMLMFGSFVLVLLDYIDTNKKIPHSTTLASYILSITSHRLSNYIIAQGLELVRSTELTWFASRLPV
ncbi:putative holin-like toxin [Limosilactobacillus fermentum]|uniref:putative holin-like toxin n=1 Tax=Limosilactobacillus fermentum TaxID=1613 RepID=UPI003709B1F1